MEMKSIAPHEPQAVLLSAEDVDRDVASLSEALIEERARRIARNVLLRSEIREILEDLLESGVCENEEEAIVKGLKILSVALSPALERSG
jgi:predicted transcriptional regulator